MSEKTDDRIEQIRSRIKQFPLGPGLYFMKDSADKVLYIGKAKNLLEGGELFSAFQRCGGNAWA